MTHRVACSTRRHHVSAAVTACPTVTHTHLKQRIGVEHHGNDSQCELAGNEHQLPVHEAGPVVLIELLEPPARNTYDANDTRHHVHTPEAAMQCKHQKTKVTAVQSVTFEHEGLGW
jgi:hypothetical protein